MGLLTVIATFLGLLLVSLILTFWIGRVIKWYYDMDDGFEIVFGWVMACVFFSVAIIDALIKSQCIIL